MTHTSKIKIVPTFSSSQSTLVVSPMPSSQSTLVVDNYASMPPSSLVDVPKPHHLRRETRKIKEYKDKRDRILRKKLGEIPQNLLEVEQPPYSSSLPPARHHDVSHTIDRHRNIWRDGSVKIINKVNKQLQEKFDVEIGKENKNNHNNEPDWTREKLFGPPQNPLGIRDKYIPFHYGRTQAFTSHPDGIGLPLLERSPILPHNGFVFPIKESICLNKESRLSYIRPGIPDGMCWVNMANLTGHQKSVFISQMCVYRTADQLKEIIKTYGPSTKRLVYNKIVNPVNNTMFFHIQEHSNGKETSYTILEDIKREKIIRNEVYIGGRLFWWGKIPEHRYPIPKEVSIRNTYGLDMTDDPTLRAPRGIVELHNIESSWVATLALLRKCDDCDSRSVGITISYKDNKLAEVMISCSTHLYIPMCKHGNIYMEDDIKYRIFFDFEDRHPNGEVYQNIIEGAIDHEVYLNNGCRDVIVRDSKFDTKEREYLQSILTVYTLVECRVILCMYQEAEKIHHTRDNKLKEVIKFMARFKYFDIDYIPFIMDKMCTILDINPATIHKGDIMDILIRDLCGSLNICVQSNCICEYPMVDIIPSDSYIQPHVSLLCRIKSWLWRLLNIFNF